MQLSILRLLKNRGVTNYTMCLEKIKIRCMNIDFEISVKFRRKNDNLIFCIHGLGCSKNNFDFIWDYRLLSDYSILTIDLPGFGDSSKPDSFSYDLKDQAEICSIILSNYKKYKIHLMGHSMGGAIGLILADMIPGQIKSFINVEGNLISQDSTVSRKKSSVTFEEFTGKELPFLILSLELSNEPGRIMWARDIKKSSVQGFYLSSRSLVEWSESGILLKKFKSLDRKKVYIHGDKNSFLKILTLLDEIPIASISHSGHFPMCDNPDDFYKYLAEFLKKQ